MSLVCQLNVKKLREPIDSLYAKQYIMDQRAI
jgi:hypothetical protein